MPPHFPKLLASFLLIASLTAPAQIIRLGTPKKSSADVGVNTVEAPIPTPLINGKKAFISYELATAKDREIERGLLTICATFSWSLPAASPSSGVR